MSYIGQDGEIAVLEGRCDIWYAGLFGEAFDQFEVGGKLV